MAFFQRTMIFPYIIMVFWVNYHFRLWVNMQNIAKTYIFKKMLCKVLDKTRMEHMWMPLEADSREMKLNTAKVAWKINAPFRSLLKLPFIWFSWLHKIFVKSGIKAKEPFKIMWRIEKRNLWLCSTEHPFRRKPFVPLSFMSIWRAIIHYTVHLHLQSFRHTL